MSATNHGNILKCFRNPHTWLVRDTDYSDYKTMDTRQYVNVDVDTVWLDGPIPSNILQDTTLDSDSIISGRFNEDRGSTKPRFNCLALYFHRWIDPRILSDHQDPCIISKLWQIGSPKQLYIVVAGPVVITSASKVKFIEPRWPPYRQSSGARFRESLYVQQGTSIAEDTTWQEVVLRFENVLRQYKDIYSMSAEEFVQGNINAIPVT
jgi:hypothetical protein